MAMIGAASFGHLLRRYRRAAGLTQEALAERALLSAFTISALERGTSHAPRKDTLALLADALALDPAERAALEAATRALGAMPASSRAPTARASGPLVGRVQELALLGRHLSGEGPPVLLFAGEPGIGKSRMLQEVDARSEGTMQTILRGGCTRRAAQEPFAPLLQALHGHIAGRQGAHRKTALQGCAWLVRLLPELAEGPIDPLPTWSLNPEQERRLMFAAVVRYLRNVAGPAGVALVLDDLQWAGPDALDLLAALVRAASEIPLRVVGAFRDTELAPHSPLAQLLGELAEAALATQVAVGPLSSSEAEALLDGLLDPSEAGDHAQRARVLARTGGVPFFLVSCARDLAPGGGMSADLPWDLKQSVQRRLAGLGELAREVLSAAAVYGRTIAYPLLRAVVAQPDAALVSALEAACQARLLVQTADDAYSFAHDVIREGAEADLSGARRRMLHLRIAEALAGQAGAPRVEALAYHFRKGGDLARAATYLEQAGDRAMSRFAVADAEARYRELVACLDQLGRVADAMHAREKQVGVLTGVFWAPRYLETLPILEDVAAHYQMVGDNDGLARVTARIAGGLQRQGLAEQAISRVEAVVACVGVGSPSGGLAMLYNAQSYLYHQAGRHQQGLDAAERAASIAGAIGDARILADATRHRGRLLQLLGDGAAARATLSEAVELAETAGDVNCLVDAAACLGLSLMLAGDFQQSRKYHDREVAVWEQVDDSLKISNGLADRAWLYSYTGDWAQAQEDLERALATSDAIGGWLAMYPRCLLGTLHLMTGQWDLAARYLTEAGDLAEQLAAGNYRFWTQRLLVDLDLLQGRPAEARARLRPLFNQPGGDEHDYAIILPHQALACLQLGDLDEAERASTQGIAYAQKEGNRLAQVDALRVRALVGIVQQRFAEVSSRLDEGLALARAMPYPYAEARLLQVAGQLHAAQGDPDGASARYQEALAIFRRLGARKDIEQVEHLLSAAG